MSAAIFITLAFLGLSFMMSIFGGGLIVILVVVYFIGASKLTKALKGRINTARAAQAWKETGMRVVTLTRQVAGVMIFNILIRKIITVTPPQPKHCILCFHSPYPYISPPHDADAVFLHTHRVNLSCIHSPAAPAPSFAPPQRGPSQLSELAMLLCRCR